MSDLKGKVALVTGAGRGIGEAVARKFAEAGAKVVLAARSASEIEAVAESIKAAGGQAESVVCDVARYESMAAAAALAKARFGGLDILINNAGVAEPIATLEQSDPDAWRDAVAVNLLGVYHGLRAALPELRRSQGVVVNISSGAAHRPLEGWGAYCAAKAGAAMLTQQAALETDGSGVRVYGFSPGTADTRMQEVIRASGINPVSQMRKEEHAHPAVPAQVIVWLCGKAAADLNGRELSIHDPELRQRAGLP